ncbi:MAG: cob(I)yrinic acid a,c-diamide adenosyltransferase [Candidatus Micrarchaeota archaeon]|nr:cob(I)yrinic acid a,c-diamide adenosyltransferase [Candidatus Micrarchaeota archaeon]
MAGKQKKSGGIEGKYVHVYTGDGGGKTTSALGLCLRAIGHGHRAAVIQFMKGRKDIGEYKARARLAPYYDIRQFGRTGWVDLKNPSKADVALAHKGLAYARKLLESKKKPDVLVLDEINIAAAYGLVGVGEVLELLDEVPDNTWVVLTGRQAPPQFINRADYVTEFVEVKHPFVKGVPAHKGIEY